MLVLAEVAMVVLSTVALSCRSSFIINVNPVIDIFTNCCQKHSYFFTYVTLWLSVFY